jgi:hypothetical protein
VTHRPGLLNPPAAAAKEEDSKQIQFRKFLEDKRRHSYAKNIGATSGLLKETSSITSQDEQDLLSMFPPETQFKVKRLLLLLRKHSNLVTWDPKTYELTIFGKHYPKSNIIDIISYLLGMNVQGKWMSEDEEHNFPRQTNTFVRVLQKALEGGTVEDYGFLNPDKFHQAARAETEDIPPDNNDADEPLGPYDYDIPFGQLFDEKRVKPAEEMMQEVRDKEATDLIASARIEAAKKWIATQKAKEHPDYFLIEQMKLHVQYLEKLRNLTLHDLKNERDAQIKAGNKLYNRAATSMRNSKRKLYDSAVANIGRLEDLIRMTPGDLEIEMAREASLHNWDYYAKLREALDIVTSAPPYGYGGKEELGKKTLPPPDVAPEKAKKKKKNKEEMTLPVPAVQPALVVPPLPPAAAADDDVVAAAADIIAGAAADDDDDFYDAVAGAAAAAAPGAAAAAPVGPPSSTDKRAESKNIDANQFNLLRRFEGETTRRAPKRTRKATDILDIGSFNTSKEAADKKKRAESTK